MLIIICAFSGFLPIPTYSFLFVPIVSLLFPIDSYGFLFVLREKSMQRYCFFLNYANFSPKNFVFSCFFFFLLSIFCISYLAMKARTIVSVVFLRLFMALVLLAGLIPRAFPLRSLPPSSVSRDSILGYLSFFVFRTNVIRLPTFVCFLK